MEVEGFRVSNLELERFFKCNGENLSNNFVGVFPADEKREFINEIQHNDKAKYPFMIANTDRIINLMYTGGRFWIRAKETLYYFFWLVRHIQIT